MTGVPRSQPNLAQRLQDHATSDHERGCMGRQYSCSCGYDATTEKLLVEAAEHIRGLERELGQALRQWKMYAEIEERDLASEKSLEADLYRSALSHAGPRDGER